MEINGFYTQKGLALSAKVLAGKTLTITRVVSGSGQTGATASALAQSCQTLAVNTPTYNGDTATIPVTLAAASAVTDYTLTELGVYAKDPDEGEILYRVYRMDTTVEILAGSSAVLRFYLKETVSSTANVTVSCSPAGLITETEFEPVRKKTLATSVQSKTVTLNAAELPAYIASLPRFLTEDLIVTVSGTLMEPLTIDGFHGCGQLRIQATALGDCVFQNQTFISNCSVPVSLFRLEIEAPSTLSGTTALIDAARSRYVRVYGCTLTGYQQTASVRAVSAGYGSLVAVDECVVSDFYTAVIASYGSIITVANYTGTEDWHDNQVGAYLWCGGTVILGNDVLNTLGGAWHEKRGGMIVAANGTLL